MPVHPLVGQSLRLVRTYRRRNGRRDVDLEHPGGWVIRVPEAWTDRMVASEPANSGARATAWALARLGETVNRLLEDSIDEARDSGHEGRRVPRIHAETPPSTAGDPAEAPLGGVADGGAGRAGGVLGNPHPASGRRGHQKDGGKP